MTNNINDLSLVMNITKKTPEDIEKLKEISAENRKELISNLCKKYKLVPAFLDKVKKIKWSIYIEAFAAPNLPDDLEKILNVKNSIQFKVLTDFCETPSHASAIEPAIEKNIEHKKEELTYRLASKINTVYMDLILNYEQYLSDKELIQFSNSLKSVFKSGLKESNITFAHIKEILPLNLKKIIDAKDSEKNSKDLGLDDYPQSFPLARMMKRHFKFRVGPTNSGKTYEALTALKSAKTGLYLAPLRLLALEAYDALTQAGVICNLITGEEKIIHEGATHTASTVEMLNPEKTVEVTVIDEIQMITDDQRGWAWTAAFVGVPCKEIYMCGADNALDRYISVINAMGDTYEVTHLTRKAELIIDKNPKLKKYHKDFHFLELKQGDAIIAFSRKDVLTLTAHVRRAGFTASCIYGALSPEVRKHQAESFNSKKTDILIATDAVGMGLNLPIRRVIFSTLEKFNGVEVGPLETTHIKQIAGRAGRFGLYDKGYATASNKQDIDALDKGWKSENKKFKGKLPIAPNITQLYKLGEFLNTTNIGDILSYFMLKLAINDKFFEIAKLSDTIELSYWVEKIAPDLSIEEKFIFSCAPTSDKEDDFDFFMKCLKTYRDNKQMKAPSLQTRGLGVFNPKLLWQAEQLSKDLGLYSWLALKYPDNFVDAEWISDLRSDVSEYIKKALVSQK